MEGSAGVRYPLHLACVRALRLAGLGLTGARREGSRCLPGRGSHYYIYLMRAVFYFVECKSLLIDYLRFIAFFLCSSSFCFCVKLCIGWGQGLVSERGDQKEYG